VEDQARMDPCDSLGWGGGAKGMAAAPACRSCSSEPVQLHSQPARNPLTIYMASKSLHTTNTTGKSLPVFGLLKLPDKFRSTNKSSIKYIYIIFVYNNVYSPSPHQVRMAITILYP
jgi:hypothetical protein